MNTKVYSPFFPKMEANCVDTIETRLIIDAYQKIGISNVQGYLSDVEHINIFECETTGYRFYAPFDVFGDDIFYEYLQAQRPSYYAVWRWEHEVAFQAIELGESVLEVGCGSGNFLDRIRTKTDKTYGLEFNNQALQDAQEKGLNVKMESIEAYADHHNGEYDVVCCFQVLEHITDVNSFLTAAIKALKIGGKLIIGVPNNNPYLYRYDRLHALNLPPHHAGLWNKQSLKNLQEVYSLMLISSAIEPIDDTKYFWRIQQDYWRKNNLIFFWASQLFPYTLFPIWCSKILRKLYDGRNIVAIYQKEAPHH